jgi:phytoene dehydrogenase-like protein
MPVTLDAIVIGSGPNGLSAAVALAQRGRTVRVYEAESTPGGGARSLPLTEPGFVHDLCSGVYPLALSSPFFRGLRLEADGLGWVHPEIPLAHPIDGERAVILTRSLDETADDLGADGPAYRRLMRPLVDEWLDLAVDVLAPPHLPVSRRYARFAVRAAWSASTTAAAVFRTPRARALLAGLCAHSGLRLSHPGTMGFMLVLAAAGHAVGWPFARGGAQRITGALAARLRALGGDIVCGTPIESLAELPPARVVLCDTPPGEIARLAHDRMPPEARHAWSAHRHGPGVCKIDWAMNAPIPWRDPRCARAGTVHLGGTIDEIARAEAAPWDGLPHPAPFVILAQHSLWDRSRAPAGAHTAWAYCRVPNAWRGDASDAIEAQVERFAPGFRAIVRARHVRTAPELQLMNRNLVGGDIAGGVFDLRRTLPRWVVDPYGTPARGVFICSASAPPGPGVHGMCGFYAARAAEHFAGGLST